jgi:hypothetical protein
MDYALVEFADNSLSLYSTAWLTEAKECAVDWLDNKGVLTKHAAEVGL